ncbi:unnamed protein product [Sphagnum jensenii]|uniref:Uncharacterized protein n=1 Tax=Sphagnum jensenii TaxID=128206 RepID=A0ABP0VPW1_9BRYO
MVFQKPVYNTAECDPPCRVLRALGTHFGDEDLLSMKMHKERVGNLVKRLVQHPMCGILDNDIELVRDAPNAKHKIRALILQQCDNTSMSTSHGVLSI